MNYKSFFVTLAASVVSAVIAAVGTVWWLGVHCNVRVAEVGPGFVAYGCTNAVSDAANANNGTRLEILKRDDDLAFTSDGRLGFNDKACDNHTLGVKNDGTTLRVTSFSRGRGKDYTIPIMVMPAYDVNVTGTNETIWNDIKISGTSPCGNKTGQVFHRFKGFGATDGSGKEWYLDDYRHLMGIMYLHVSASGIILGIDYTPDCSGCCRPTTTK